MVREITLADKPTLDEVKADSTHILTKVTEILNAPPDSVRTRKVINQTNSVGNEVSILNVTGRGQLRHAVLISLSSTTDHFMRIEIDGTTYAHFTTKQQYAGLFDSNLMKEGSTEMMSKVLGPTAGNDKSLRWKDVPSNNIIMNLPSTSAQNGYYPLLEPIEFETSLKIFLRHSTTSQTLVGTFIVYDLK